ncbi:GapS1 family protein [Geomonas edaphica]|uniref:GapS1 family protein n=1 Tax=Geomonas edaphica TaxID=2570226 RepID=UPI0010A7A2A1|nr:hypothetical protein [Geomonas edaphica]
MSTFDEYKVLRNRVRKYDTLSIVLLCINKLHEISKKAVHENGGYYPWHLLYLIKIAFLEGGKNGNKRATMGDVNNALNDINHLGRDSRFLEGDERSLRKFLRTVAFQQFWFQRQISSFDLARQLVIFEGDAAAELNDQFLTTTGLEINTFLQMLIAAWSGFIDNSDRRHITRGWFAPLGFNEGVIDSFFNLVSLPVECTFDFFERHYETTDDKLLQLTEQTPLKQYPFLQINENYHCYSPYVLQEKIKHAIYDILKGAYPRRFPQAFGVLFESYIIRLMDENDIAYIPEARLKEIFPNKKVCDAVIELDDAVVLIEIKGVEMHPYARINPTNAVLNRELESSIVKSFKQIYEVGNLLTTTDQGRALLNNREIFALVVTYKEMYLSDGLDVWEEFISEPLLQYLTPRDMNIDCIPLRNIIFASASAFEQLMKIVVANGNIISQVLRRAVEDNAIPETKKYLLEMHLGSYPQQPLRFLEEIFDNVTEELEAKLSHQV